MNPHSVIYDEPPQGFAHRDPLWAGILWPMQLVAVRGFSAVDRARLAVGLAHAAATARPDYLGRRVQPCSVLLVEAGGASLAEYVAECAQYNGHARTRCARLRLEGALDGESYHRVKQTIGKMDAAPRIVVVAAPCDGATLRNLAQTSGAAVLVPHHACPDVNQFDVTLICESAGLVKYAIRGDIAGIV